MLPTQTALIRHTASLIEQRTGLATNATRRSDLDSLLTELAGGDLPDFLARLRQEDLHTPTWQGVIRALAIGETYFFRDEGHFQVLRTRILPPLIASRRHQQNLTLNLWSAGCASGEEPYSLAILLHELLPDLERWTINLLATDINVQTLDAARRAIYRPWSFRQPKQDVSTYFEPVEEGMQLKPFIKDMVTFQQTNVLNDAPQTRMDVIFCRNVLLYFSPEHTVAAEAILRDALTPGGWLFLGHSESLKRGQSEWVTHLFPGAPIYQKPLTSGVYHAPVTTPVPTVMKTSAAVVKIPLSPDPEADYDHALRAYRAQDYGEARHLLTRLVTARPDDSQAWLLLACLAADRQDPADAHRALDRALQSDALLADAHYLRALLYREEDQPDATFQALRAALYCQHNHPLAGYLLSTIYAQSGEFYRAVKLWETVQGAIAGLAADEPVSDFSDMTAGQLDRLIQEQLAAWKD
ncbi:MAG: tetratricopeptide repeat protein [Anaerolineae bacterium]|nr:tetratricopeptide repeat protein [Anaerolineae bacterium]